ncbi:hypothetical protein NEF87_000876 [Candidatus Lokiarchaeum ossiferum]|uniref:Uncharacterized protein n=1 Tax=Candidatus Lokiarchaeum ossiferum TaxID=2951803 RepID=A0ABY6HM52_9ARCH|nr:hypothetical protein NEF87_000876 [Candidatus Lokiarchaeum sp. B-35]
MSMNQSKDNIQLHGESLFYSSKPHQYISFDESLENLAHTAAKYKHNEIYLEIQDKNLKQDTFPSLSEAVKAIDHFLNNLHRTNQSLYHQIKGITYEISTTN